MLHIDGDLLVYRCGFAAEKTHYYLKVPYAGGDEAVKHFSSKKELDGYLFERNYSKEDAKNLVEARRELEPLKNALYNVKSVVQTIVDKTRCSVDDTIIYLSGPTNFRMQRATIRPYKGNRDPDHKPTYAQQIKEYMRRHYKVVESKTEEADDTLAIAHMREYAVDPDSSIIATIDKDLDMVPGLHYNFVKDIGYVVSPAEARYSFYRQLISGDMTDNVVGIPNYGPAKAEKLLSPIFKSGKADMFAEMENLIESLYVQAYEDRGREAMQECADLLWIRQEPEQQVPWARKEQV